ncbi:MAG: acylphosphatase [Nitrososphaerales archaeon]
MQKDQLRAVNLIVTGHVQDVFFRSTSKSFAEDHSLVGWIRNNHDSSVKALVQGRNELVGKAIE